MVALLIQVSYVKMEITLKETSVKRSVEMVQEDRILVTKLSNIGIILTKMNVTMATKEQVMDVMKNAELKEVGIVLEEQQPHLMYALQFVVIGHTMIENSVMMVM
jgi:hypothetical protein